MYIDQCAKNGNSQFWVGSPWLNNRLDPSIPYFTLAYQVICFKDRLVENLQEPILFCFVF